MYCKVDDESIRARLLMAETVQTDLGLTVDQTGKLKNLAQIAKRRSRELLARLHEVFPPGQAFPAAEFEARQREFQAWRGDADNRGRQLRREALAVLTPRQSERLKQIQMQTAVSAAMTWPEIIKALKISGEQRAKIRAICEQTDQKLVADFPEVGHLDLAERRQKIIGFIRQTEAEATKGGLEVLNAEQRTKFEKLQGTKIDATQLRDALIPEGAEF